MRFLATISILFAITAPSGAMACRLATAGSKCVVAGPSVGEWQSNISRLANRQYRGAPIPRGTILPRNKYNILLLADYYGLPPVRDGWVYIEVERNVYRVDFLTYEVLEMVTDQTAANW